MERSQPQLRLQPPCEDALGAAFRAHSGYVAGIALKLLGRRDDADDVVQEVFLVALKGLAQIREPEATRGWLATVTARTARRKLRMRRLRGFVGLDAPPAYAQLAVRATQEQSALVGRIYGILDEIPVDRRIAWVLRNVEGEPLDRVAAVCCCSLATAKRRISAAQLAIDKAVRE